MRCGSPHPRMAGWRKTSPISFVPSAVLACRSGQGHVLRAVEALRTIDIMDRDEFYWALHASLITRQGQREVFDQAFHMFWRSPDYLERMMGMLLPTLKVEDEAPADKRELSRALQMHWPPPRRKRQRASRRKSLKSTHR